MKSIKKVCFVLLVLFAATIAQADLQISVHPTTQPLTWDPLNPGENDITINVNEDLTLGIYTNTLIFGGQPGEGDWFLMCDTNLGSISGGVANAALQAAGNVLAIYNGKAAGAWQIADPSDGVGGGVFVFGAPMVPMDTLYNQILFRCNGPGDVVIELVQGVAVVPPTGDPYIEVTGSWDTVVIHQNAGPGDVIAPTAGGSVAGITSAGGTTHSFTVTYSDNVAVDVSDLDGSDVLVTGPSSYSQAASFVSVDVPTDGSPRVATYQVTAPGGSWDEADNGTYTLTMQASQVSDTATTANFVAGVSLGTFDVNIPAAPTDVIAPTAGGSAADITIAGGATHSFTVTYSDNVAVDVSDLDGSDVLVTGPNSYNQAASFVSVDVAGDGSPRVATYQIPAPGGSWDETDNGTYTVTMQASQVSDIATPANFVAGASLSTFDVNIPTTPTDSIAPTAGGSATDITSGGGATHNFTVTYSDNVAVDVSDLDGSDVLVTGPSSYSQAASFVSVDVAGDGSPRVATYQIPAPDGSWDETDNGTYTVTMQASQVSDTATTANFVAGGSLGTFDVNIPVDTGDDLTLAKAVVRAGRSRNSTDFFLLSGGSLDLVEADLAGVAKITVGLYTDITADPNFSEEITYNPANLRRLRYVHRGSAGKITMLQLNLKRKTFLILAKNVDLSGLGSPFMLRMEIGSKIFTALADEAVINGPRAKMPLQLMAGVQDILQLNRTPIFRSGNRGDTLVLIGSIIVKDRSVNLANEDILFSWDGFNHTLAAVNTKKIGARSLFIHRKIDRATRKAAVGVFDFDKGIFKITLKNFTIGDQGDQADFGLAFGGFNQMIQVDLP